MDDQRVDRMVYTAEDIQKICHIDFWRKHFTSKSRLKYLKLGKCIEFQRNGLMSG